MKNKILHLTLIFSFIAICFQNSNAQTNCSDLPANLKVGLIVYYSFTGNADDLSGNGNNGNVSGATLIPDRFGNPDCAYHFDGLSYIKGSCNTFPTQARTISMWYKIDNWANHNTLMGYGGGNCGTSFFATLNSGTQPGTLNTSSHCEVNDAQTTDSYTENSNWNNWIVTADATKTTYYLNGVKFYQTNVSYYGTDVAGKDFAFGSMSSPSGFAPYSDGNVSYLQGELDDITLYNRALDSAEAVQLYNFFSGYPINGNEICNGVDDNCDGIVDNIVATIISPTNNVSVCSGTYVALTANADAGTYQWMKGANAITGATNQTYSTNKAGNYKVKETCSTHNSTSSPRSISIITLPSATITAPNGLDLCGHTSLLLQANSGIGYTYQWKKGANNIANATNQTYTATMKATYKVIVTNASGCSKTSSGAKVVKTCKESDPLNSSEVTSFIIYPNPSTTEIHLSIGAEQNETGTLKICNALGQVGLQQSFSLTAGINQYSLDVHSLPSGIYYAVLRRENSEVVQKFVKE